MVEFSELRSEPVMCKHRLWHIELEFDVPVSGPLVLGDGRFLGLGLLKPVRTRGGVFGFQIESGLTADADPQRLARAFRRAVMARIGDEFPRGKIPAYFAGHREDGRPARSEDEPHIAFAFDPTLNQLLIITPDLLDRSERRASREHLAVLETAMEDLTTLRAGSDGKLCLRPIAVDQADHPVLVSSHTWESVTPYDVNRHARRSTAESILVNDVRDECERRGLPRPVVTVLNWSARKQIGLQGRLRLKFGQAVTGPVLLGRTRHLGGGLFHPVVIAQEVIGDS